MSTSVVQAGALPALTLVLGGARSGKSRYAEGLVESFGGALVYLATAEPGDAEMAARIAAHRSRRGGRWRTFEEPLDLPGVLGRTDLREAAILVDCLTLWLANLLGAAADFEQAADDLLASLAARRGPTVLVSNEVGLGVVPLGADTRAFVDRAGQLHQRIAARADRVVLLAAGLPLFLKPQIQGAA